MSLSATIAPHLPFLRRFSRAVSGSQHSGDALVAAMLEAIIADISIFPKASNERIALYRLFAETVHLGFDPRSARERADRLGAAGGRQSRGPGAARAAGFPSDRGRRLLERVRPPKFSTSTDGEFADLLTQASNEISRQVATDILIIEDEPLIAMDIEQMVESLGHRVVGTARTHAEATALFKKTRAKMVLADIQLADGSSGIDAVNEILSTTSVPVIFITAFPERLLTGERPEPAFLVTKPFNPDMVKALISQALFFDRQAKAAA